MLQALGRHLTRPIKAEDTYDLAYQDITEPSEEIDTTQSVTQSEFLFVLDTTRDHVQHLKSVM